MMASLSLTILFRPLLLLPKLSLGWHGLKNIATHPLHLASSNSTSTPEETSIIWDIGTPHIFTKLMWVFVPCSSFSMAFLAFSSSTLKTGSRNLPGFSMSSPFQLFSLLRCPHFPKTATIFIQTSKSIITSKQHWTQWSLYESCLLQIVDVVNIVLATFVEIELYKWDIPTNLKLFQGRQLKS